MTTNTKPARGGRSGGSGTAGGMPAPSVNGDPPSALTGTLQPGGTWDAKTITATLTLPNTPENWAGLYGMSQVTLSATPQAARARQSGAAPADRASARRPAAAKREPAAA